jgi:hypothetical protein
MIEKLTKVVRELEAEKGGFELFGLFLREDSFGFWDIVLSASWIDADRFAAMKHIAKKIADALTAKEMLQFSRMVPMSTTDTAVREFGASLVGANLPKVIQNFDLAGARILVAHVLAVQPKGSEVLTQGAT